MNLELTLPIFHLFTGLIMVTAALFSYLSDRKSTANRLLAIVLILISLTSVGIGFQLNSLTPGQALPWVSLDIFVVNALGIATLIISLQLLIPEVGSKPIIRTIALAIVFVPLILLVIDLTGESVNLVGTHFIINLNDFYSNFTPGYSKIRVAADGVVHNGLFWLRNILYMVLIFYPLVFVIWRDRKANPFNRTNAIILLSGTLISAAVNTVFLDILPETVPALISALSYGVILTLISIRNSLAISSKWRTFDFFQNINMFNKFLLIMLGIILPSVIFLGFSIYSLLLKNMVNDSNAFLNDFAKSQAAITANELDDLLHNLEHAAEERSVQDLFSTTNVSNSELQTLTGLLQQSSGIRSVLLIDSRGRLITSSESADSNNYPNTSWWEALSEQQTAYIGSPIWDEEEVSYTLQVVFPATTSNGEFIGAIETKYSLDQLLLSFNHQTNTDLVYAINVSNQNLVLSENTENSIFQLPAWMATSVEPARNWNVISINDQYVFTASQPVITETPTTPLDWEISAYQSLDSALETLYTSRNGLVLISTGIFLITAIAFIFVARGISNPLRKLTESAETLLGGNFEIEIEVLGQDEIGTLANTLNQMASELSGMINSLEATVDNRTKDLQRRTLQMETSAQVARQAAEIRDLQSLLNQSVNLISERFDYYHAGIFLLDNAGRYAVLQAASSPGGQRMLARGHRLQVGKVGVVGYTAGSGQPRISQDVGADVVYYDNPDMPQTRSELALPLMVRNNVIGVLDVQSIESTAFATEDVDVLQTLADQIALAIDNVRLLQSSQRALDELQRLYGQQAGQAWRQKLTGRPKAYQFTPTGLEEGDQKAEISLQNRPGYKLRKEIKFRGQVIGNLNLMREQDDASWSDEEQSLVDEILEQTALALENARLVDQIRLRSEQIELLQEISTISSEILDEEKLLPIITEKLLTSLAVSHCGIVLLGNIKATLAANIGDVAGVPEAGTSINIDDEPISQRLIRNKEVDIFKIESGDERTLAFANTFSVPETKTVICLPIIVREQTAGFIYLDETSADREIDAEEFNLFNQLSTQISTAVENIRLFDETSNRAERERQVAEITAKMRSTNDPKSILQTAVLELKKALKAEPQKTDDIQTSTPSPTGD